MNLDVSTADGYNVAAALRGPDVDFFFGYVVGGGEEEFYLAVKNTFTRRIRFFAGVAASGSNFINSLPFTDDERQKNVSLAENLENRPPWWGHWYDHMDAALVSISVHNISADKLSCATALLEHLSELGRRMLVKSIKA